jgi:hypothetical protein
MADFYAQYPVSSSGSNPSIGTNGATIPVYSTEVGAEDPSGNLQPLQVDAAGNLLVNIADTTVNPLPVTDAAAEASLTSIDSKITVVDTSDVTVTASVLPTGAATEASLTSIDGKITVVDTSDVTVTSSALPTGAATEATLSAQAANIASLEAKDFATETTLAAFSAKTAGSLVPESFDYQDITYVGATTDINTVVYKTGGSGGTTVATLTMGYDGSNRLTSVTRS